MKRNLRRRWWCLAILLCLPSCEFVANEFFFLDRAEPMREPVHERP